MFSFTANSAWLVILFPFLADLLGRFDDLPYNFITAKKAKRLRSPVTGIWVVGPALGYDKATG